VSFVTPGSDGGGPIVFYTVIATPGNHTAIGSGSPISVTGLSNGTQYSFTVTASNAAGVGPASTVSNSVIPLPPEDAVCGSDNGKTMTSIPTNLCAPGTLIDYSGTGPWSWTCQGNYGGANALCSAAFVESSPVILVGSSQSFSSLQQAYDAAGDGATIKARAEVPAEKLVPGSTAKKVYILGGYEATFSTQTGYTAILGKFTISRGSIVLNRVIIR
jgi:hypothetical protein